MRLYSPKLLQQPALFLVSLLLVACGGSIATVDDSEPSTAASMVEGLQVVDCLLPGQVRRLGNSTYVTPRRPTRTTAADCGIRGGEFVAYDRADYKTALNVWMAAAEAGDADAQANVGEIFEQGHGGKPNYTAAAVWYNKAAEQGNARGQFNLGTLYEQGLGVEKDMLRALNLYRKAWGMPEDDVIFQSAAYEQQKALRDQLQQQIAAKDSQIKLLGQQVDQLQSNLKLAEDDTALQDQIAQLKKWIADIQTEQLDARKHYASLPVFRKPTAPSGFTERDQEDFSNERESKFGKYYALVIGNQDYHRLDKLNSPRYDASRVADLLENKYGFSVRVLLDASNIAVMQAINDLNDTVGENDNLLIYYAGHGSRIQSGDLESGYWLPVNADPPPTDTFWVSNEFITRHLARLKAKRIMVVADSCYAGLLSSAPGYLFLGDKAHYDDEYMRYKLSKKARLLLSSGADKPVLDNAGNGHSVFARAFIDVLENNQKIMAGPDLYTQLKGKVEAGAKSVGFDQQPEFKAMKGAGHEVGDFFFVPVNSAG